MSAIGSILKEARNKKSVSLEEVHSKIKIHPRVLQILEEGKFEKLPSPIYVKSFLKSYADFLEVNGDDLVRTYEKEGQKLPDQQIFIRTAAERDAPKLPQASNVLTTIFAVLIAAALVASIFYAVKVSGSWFKRVEVSSVSPAKKAEKTSTPAEPASKIAESANLLRSVAQGNFPKIAKDTPISLRIKAADSVWLRITADGKVLFQSILKKGASETWVAQKNIEIWTGNSSNMTLWVNGSSLGSPGKGSVKKLTVSRDGVLKLA